MTDGVDFKVDGFDELRNKFEQVKGISKGNEARNALRRAANILRDQARANVKKYDDAKTPEDIAKNIVATFASRTSKRTGNIAFRVGVMGGAKNYAETRENVRKGRVGAEYKTLGDKSNPGGDTWYWRFLEFGTKKAGAKPFMRPIVGQVGDKSFDEFFNQFDKALDRSIKKGNK